MPIPIIGDHTQLSWWPTTLVSCGCNPSVIITIHGFSHPTYCPLCKKGYVAEGMASVENGKKVLPNILVLPAPVRLD